MSEKLQHIVISAVAGAAAAVGVLRWTGQTAPKPAETPAAAPAEARFEELEVDRLKVNGGLWVCHSETGEPLIELKDGVVLAKNEVLSRYVGGLEMVGRKLQITTGDPSAADPPIFCEVGAGDGGQGAYIAMLSPKGTHSVNLGFDKNETGFIVSRNNGDEAMTAQVVLPVPRKEDGAAPDPAEEAPAAETTDEQTAAAPAADAAGGETPAETPAPKPFVSAAEPPEPARLAMNPAEEEPAEKRIPAGLPMLTPAKPK